MMIRIIFVITLACTLSINLNGQNAGNLLNNSRLELASMNDRIEQLYVAEDINALISLYAGEFSFFPEYKPGIFDTRRLNQFFNNWFTTGEVKKYSKDIFAVEVYSDYLLELGTFSIHYSSIKHPQGEYRGKYMVLWERSNKGSLSIVSETFGADTYIEPEFVPYADVLAEETNFTALESVNRKLLAEVEEFDAIVLKAVADGDGNARANGFTEDAILLSNFDSIRVGMEHIRPKMLQTYTPNVSFVVKHHYNRIYDLGGYIFVVGHYEGGWGDSNKGGRFEGNMCNLLKRTKSGKLLMHRQAGNRDRALELFDN